MWGPDSDLWVRFGWMLFPVCMVLVDAGFSIGAVGGGSETCYSECFLGILSVPFAPLASPLRLAGIGAAEGGITTDRLVAAYAVVLLSTLVWWWYLGGRLPLWAASVCGRLPRRLRNGLVRLLVAIALFVLAAAGTTYAKLPLVQVDDSSPWTMALVEAAIWGAVAAVAVGAALLRRRKSR